MFETGYSSNIDFSVDRVDSFLWFDAQAHVKFDFLEAEAKPWVWFFFYFKVFPCFFFFFFSGHLSCVLLVAALQFAG